MKAFNNQIINGDKPNFSEDSQSYVDQYLKKNSSKNSSQQQKQSQTQNNNISSYSDADDLKNFSTILKRNDYKDIQKEDEDEDRDQGGYDIEDGIEGDLEEKDFKEINWDPGKIVSTRVSLDELDVEYDIDQDLEEKDPVNLPRKF